MKNLQFLQLLLLQTLDFNHTMLHDNISQHFIKFHNIMFHNIMFTFHNNVSQLNVSQLNVSQRNVSQHNVSQQCFQAGSVRGSEDGDDEDHHDNLWSPSQYEDIGFGY